MTNPVARVVRSPNRNVDPTVRLRMSTWLRLVADLRAGFEAREGRGRDRLKGRVPGDGVHRVDGITGRVAVVQGGVSGKRPDLGVSSVVV